MPLLDRQFSLQFRAHCFSLDRVRCAVTFCLLCFLLVARAFSQDQERKLVDRLLRPDMELKNDAQNKKFTADRTSVQKKATLGSFYMQQRPVSKQFAGTRDFSTSNYDAGSFSSAKRKANTSSRNQIVNSSKQYPTSMASGPDAARDSKKSVDGKQFAGQHKFLDQGKSQKSLNQKNRPMTIEEVRELLNKNK